MPLCVALTRACLSRPLSAASWRFAKGLGDVQTFCCNCRFILHTLPRKRLFTRARRGACTPSHRWFKHTHHGGSPPALVHTCVPQLLADALSTTAELSRSRAAHAGARHFRCDREGSLPGQNGGFLIQNYTVGVSFVASGMSVPVLPNFTSLSLSQKGLHPAEQKKGESTHQEYLDDEAIAWEPRWRTGSDRQSHTDKLLHQTAAQVYSSARHGLNVQI